MADLLNFREIGGVRNAEGQLVRSGLVYRSCALDGLAPDDTRLAALQLRTVVDLRSADELSGPVCIPLGTRREVITISPTERSAAGDLRPETGLTELLATIASGSIGDPRRAARLAVRMHSIKTHRCVNLRTLMRMRQPLVRFLSLITSQDDLPLLYHCRAGKDRTGIVTAVVLSALGVPNEGIVRDYRKSNRAFAQVGLASYLRQLQVDQAPWQDELLPLFGVLPEGLDRLLGDFEAAGGADAALVKHVGVPQQLLRRLRAVLLC